MRTRSNRQGRKSAWNIALTPAFGSGKRQGERDMGKGILMWLIGIPIPIILIILLLWH
jgi:hypothetical protein